MFKAVARSVGAVLASIIVGLLLLAAIEGISAVLHPFPADFVGTPQDMMNHVANYPAWVLALLGGGGWALTMLVIVWLATRLGSGQHPAHGYGVGALLLAAAAFNLYMLPYPLWFVLLDLVLLPAALIGGIKLATATGAVSQNE
ncbi:MAG: hypothetical protein RL120_08375 [Gammaproteobacteria bacterium]